MCGITPRCPLGSFADICDAEVISALPPEAEITPKNRREPSARLFSGRARGNTVAHKIEVHAQGILHAGVFGRQLQFARALIEPLEPCAECAPGLVPRREIALDRLHLVVEA